MTAGRTAWTRWVVPAVAAVATSLVVAGCGQAPELAPDRAAALQAGVLAVSEEAAAGRYDTAQAALEQVRDDLEEAVDAGDVSTDRYRRIDEALDSTAQEIAASLEVQALQQAAAEQAAAEQAAAEQAAAEQAAAEQAAAEQAAAEAAAAERAAAEQAAADRRPPEPAGGPRDEDPKEGKGKGRDGDD